MFYYILVANAFISLVNTQTAQIKLVIYNSIAMISLKILYPGGIRTRVFGSWGGSYVHFATPPGLKDVQFVNKLKQIFFDKWFNF
jgi:hypothetical protein